MVTRNTRALRPTRPTRTTARTPEQQNAARLAQLRTMPPIRVHVPPPPLLIITAYTRPLMDIAATCYGMTAPVLAELHRLQALADLRMRADAAPEDEEFALTPMPPQAKHWTEAEIAEFRRASWQNAHRGAGVQLALPLTLERALVATERRLQLYSDRMPTEGIAGKAARELERHASAVNVRVMGTLGLNPIDPGSALDKARAVWLADNAALIRSQPTEVAERVRALVEKGVPAGMRWETLAKRLQEEEGIAKNRAALIARDQIGKYGADLNRLQQRAAGIPGYTYRGALDNRERDTHVAMEGTVWTWDSEPWTGHPGTAPLCRCWGEPALSDQQLRNANSVSEDDLINRTAALGRLQRESADITPAQIRERAARSVAAGIKLAARRTAGAHT